VRRLGGVAVAEGSFGVEWLRRVAEARAAQAQRAGELDGLPGKGKPLPPDPYATVPASMRAAVRVLSNAECPPEEVELRREMDRARQALEAASDGDARREAMRQFVDAELRYNLAIDRYRRISREFTG
jgi:hypothetical protein